MTHNDTTLDLGLDIGYHYTQAGNLDDIGHIDLTITGAERYTRQSPDLKIAAKPGTYRLHFFDGRFEGNILGGVIREDGTTYGSHWMPIRLIPYEALTDPRVEPLPAEQYDAILHLAIAYELEYYQELKRQSQHQEPSFRLQLIAEAELGKAARLLADMLDNQANREYWRGDTPIPTLPKEAQR